MKPVLLSARDTIDRSVRDPDGDVVGRLRDLTIDLSTGQVAYAIVAWQSAVDEDAPHYAIPWSSVQQSTAEGDLVVELSGESLRNACRVDLLGRREETRHQWQHDVFDYYRCRPLD